MSFEPLDLVISVEGQDLKVPPPGVMEDLFVGVQTPPDLVISIPDENCELVLNIEDNPLVITAEEELPVIEFTLENQEIVFGLPCPIGVGEENAAANVGGAQEVFRDKTGNVLNFRTLEPAPGSPVTVTQVGDTVQIGSSAVANKVFAVDPTVNDDSLAGCAIGDIWVNTTNDTSFILVDDTAGAAVWEQFVGAVWIEDQFFPFNGQITFILTKAPKDIQSFMFEINGVNAVETTDFTISGTNVTWLNTLYAIEAGDCVIARYR